MEQNHDERKKVIFLSSSYVNLGKLFALKNPDIDTFLIHDRKFPFEVEDLDNFYPLTFDKNKIFEKDKRRYFDNLAVFCNQFEPDIIIANNFTKILINEFIEFMKFTNPNIKILNIHHGDLRIIEEGDMKYKGLNSEIKQFLEEEKIISTIHHIEDGGMDNGTQVDFSHETTLKELKMKGFLHKKEDIINYRIKNVVLSYHERTKVLNLISKVVRNILDKQE